MSVLVKGMKMPKSCSDCELCYDMMECCVGEPIINFFRVKEFDFCTERHPRCPLVPAADVRPVVRCKDCALWNAGGIIDRSTAKPRKRMCANWQKLTESEDYCSIGEVWRVSDFNCG